MMELKISKHLAWMAAALLFAGCGQEEPAETPPESPQEEPGQPPSEKPPATPQEFPPEQEPFTPPTPPDEAKVVRHEESNRCQRGGE